MSDGDAYQRLLHAWARKQLEQHSGHAGPFEIKSVSVDQVYGHSVGSDYLAAYISFHHTGCKLTNWNGSPCRDTMWSLPETTDVVTMLNEMLALADEPGTER